MKKRKTIKSLMSSNKVVYVKLANEKVADAFVSLAKYEGFTLTEEVVRAGGGSHCFVRLNENMSISYPDYRTWGGAMRFHHSKIENGKRVVKIDFEKML